MPSATPDEWLFEDWQLIGRALQQAKHEECRCYECDTIDAMIDTIAHYWDCEPSDLLTVVD